MNGIINGIILQNNISRSKHYNKVCSNAYGVQSLKRTVCLPLSKIFVKKALHFSGLFLGFVPNYHTAHICGDLRTSRTSKEYRGEHLTITSHVTSM